MGAGCYALWRAQNRHVRHNMQNMPLINVQLAVWKGESQKEKRSNRMMCQFLERSLKSPDLRHHVQGNEGMLQIITEQKCQNDAFVFEEEKEEGRAEGVSLGEGEMKTDR